MDYSDEVFRESQWDILDWMPKDIIHNMGECVDQVIAAVDQGFLLILQVLALCGLLSLVSAAGSTDHLVECHEGVYSLEEISFSQLLDVV